MEFMEFVKTYKDIGITGVWLLTLWKFYSDLKEHKKEAVALIERYATSLDQANNAINRSSNTMDGVSKSIQESRQQTSEFIAFVRGRDDGSKRS